MLTETADPRYASLERWPTETLVAAMVESQLAAIAALDSARGAIAAAADAVADRLGGGGRLCYAGAGTSGRVAVQDGVELTPTYGWAEDRLVFLMAGGLAALTRGIEGAEDDADAGRAAVADARIGATDVLIGVAASGRTPYTRAAVAAARAAGALTVAVANNPGSALLDDADHAILAVTGAEVVAGSTRMKAGTAQKAVLNILSTAVMIRLGYVHDGLMVHMRATNAKLQARAAAMVERLAGVGAATAAALLARCDHDVATAVVMARGASLDEARDRLAAAGGSLARLDAAA